MVETKKRKGFAAMTPEARSEICRKGGRAAQASGRAHRFTSDEARAAGKKGGHAISKNREHMAAIGRVGGAAVSSDLAHMAEIGKKGGDTAAANSRDKTSPEEG